MKSIALLLLSAVVIESIGIQSPKSNAEAAGSVDSASVVVSDAAFVAFVSVSVTAVVDSDDRSGRTSGEEHPHKSGRAMIGRRSLRYLNIISRSVSFLLIITYISKNSKCRGDKLQFRRASPRKKAGGAPSGF
jgi:hypothetical protein